MGRPPTATEKTEGAGAEAAHQRSTTYDLTVGTLHTYYVPAGGTPLLVHNCLTGGAVTLAVDVVKKGLARRTRRAAEGD